jgi:hypothetical protein
MSALLREPKAGPWGVYQIQAEVLRDVDGAELSAWNAR